MTRVYSDIEIPSREILFRMERNGVLIDSDLLAQQSNELGKRLLELEALCHEAAGQPFNVNSPKQLAEILFTKLGIPVLGPSITADEPANGQRGKKADPYPGLARVAPTNTDQARALGSHTRLLYTSPSPRDQRGPRMPSSA